MNKINDSTQGSNSPSPYGEHKSVLLNEVLQKISTNAEKEKEYSFLDLTFGGGGHSFSILKHFPNSKVLACDQDLDAINNGKMEIEKKGVSDRIVLKWTNFIHLPQILSTNQLEDFFKMVNKKNLTEFDGFHGILLDLGVSSHQFDTISRGFSFRGDSFLDMRMNHHDDQVLTASELINTLSESELASIIFEYGEERFSKIIARNIIQLRNEGTIIKTTKELENVVFHSYPRKLRNQGIHPATRTFQALRIAVNDELKSLNQVLPLLFKLLAKNGRLLCITFHSLEDRIVKHTFKKLFIDQKESTLIVTPKPIYPSEEEIKENPRSRSSKLRIIQKL